MIMYWRYTAITLAIGIGVDIFIANLLADDRVSAWWWLVVLVIVPVIFSVKTGAIRTLLWLLHGKKNLVDEYKKMLSNSGWPKIEYECQDAEDYMLEASKKSHDIVVKLEAATMYGYLRALYETQQITGALQLASALKTAINECCLEQRSGDAI